MKDRERVFLLIGRGEGESVEFKRNEKSVAETVCAFANTLGGTVLVGVDDSGNIVGVGKDVKERVSNHLHALNPFPRVRIREVRVDGKTVLIIDVEKSEALVFLGTRAYIRVGRSNRPLSLEEMMERSVELTALKFDMLPSPHGPEILKREYVEWYLKRREEMRGIPARGNYRQNLIKLKAIVKRNGTYHATYGAILFFSENPDTYIESASLRVIDFRGQERTVEFKGPVWKIIDEAYSYLMNELRMVDIRVGPRRERILEYPEEAIREGIINALAHRNYLIPADVRIFIYEDRLVIRNPGSFPPGVSPEEPEHHPRNPLLCTYLYDTGYIERYGFGIERMKSSCDAHPLCRIEFRVSPSKVDVVLKKGESSLDDMDMKIVSLIRGNPMSSSEIAKNLGVSKVTVLNRIKRLMVIGTVRKIGSGPTTRYVS